MSSPEEDSQGDQAHFLYQRYLGFAAFFSFIVPEDIFGRFDKAVGDMAEA